MSLGLFGCGVCLGVGRQGVGSRGTGGTGGRGFLEVWSVVVRIGAYDVSRNDPVMSRRVACS